jgi:hypothetical protein
MIPVLVVLAALQGGCVSWHGGAAREIDPFPTAAMQGAPRRSLWLDVEYRVGGVRDLFYPEEKRDRFRERLLKVGHELLYESKRFGTGLPNISYHLHVKSVNSGNPNRGLAVLSGLTLLVIPAVATDYYDIEATLRDPFGRTIAVRRLRQELTTVFQVLMLFGMPFANPWQVQHRMWTSIFQDLFVFCDEEISRYEKARASGLPAAP